MFNNVEELRAEILAGKTNEEIIRERLAYLNSEEYRANRMPTIKRPGTSQIMFYDGFISPEETIAINGGRIADCLYKMDETSIYESLINLIRNNMDKKGFNFRILVQMVIDYFKCDENSRYYELSQYLKKINPRNPYFAREEIPYIIHQYINSNFSGSIMDFTMGYLHHWFKGFKADDPHIAELDEKYFNSVDWNKIDEGDVILPISSIKGAGIAACTENAILTQNCLAFLGYDTYLLGGELTVGEKTEQHNFNVIRMPSDGRYAIVDSAQRVACKKIENASSITDIKNMQGVSVTRSSIDETKVSYTSAPEIRTKTPTQQREEDDDDGER